MFFSIYPNLFLRQKPQSGAFVEWLFFSLKDLVLPLHQRGFLGLRSERKKPFEEGFQM
jgi:hypothetical protein